MILLENGTACNAQACGVKVIYRNDSAPAAHIPVITSLEEVEKQHILCMLDRHQWNIAKTSRGLNIDRTTLHKSDRSHVVL